MKENKGRVRPLWTITYTEGGPVGNKCPLLLSSLIPILSWRSLGAWPPLEARGKEPINVDPLGQPWGRRGIWKYKMSMLGSPGKQGSGSHFSALFSDRYKNGLRQLCRFHPAQLLMHFKFPTEDRQRWTQVGSCSETNLWHPHLQPTTPQPQTGDQESGV